MIASFEVALVGCVVQKIFAIAQESGQTGVGIAVMCCLVGTELAPPVGE